MLDARAQKTDSSSLQFRIKKFSQQHNFTRWVYRLIFSEEASHFSRQLYHDASTQNEFQCKIIRSVTVYVLDPYEWSKDVDANSVNRRPRKFTNAINSLHLTTRKWVIRNQLLFHPFEEFETLLLEESERLLRQLDYVQDAKISVQELEQCDSVDVDILVWDRWSLIAPFSFNSFQNVSSSLIEKNLLGTGQRFEQRISYYDEKKFGYSVSYDISNLDHSFIRARVYFNADTNQTDYGVAFNRTLFSPVILWAGGAAIIGRTFSSMDSSISLSHKTTIIQNDWWLAKNTPVRFLNGEHKRVMNFVAGFRFTNLDLKQETSSAPPPITAQSSYLFTAGITQQEFYKTQFLYRFGTKEDIPIGFRVQASFGKLFIPAGATKNYFGFQSALAFYTHGIYCSLQFTDAKYRNRESLIEQIRQFNIFCFSEPFQIRRWDMRLFGFLKAEVLNAGSTGRTLQLETGDLYGNAGSVTTGRYKSVLNLEAIAYAPFDILGFKLGYMMMWGCGVVSDAIQHIKKSNAFVSFVTGFLFRNEHLLNSTFQFSIGYFPTTPNGESHVFRFNPVSTFTLRLNSFGISKPSFIF